MEFTALQHALLRKPRKSKTSLLPSSGAPPRPPEDTTARISTILSDVVYAAPTPSSVEIPPEAARRRSSLLERQYFQVQDETKRQLKESNATLQTQVNELRQINTDLQRQMAVQQEEFLFAKAQWNDQLLDLHGSWDAKLLSEKRKSEQQSNQLLEQELQEMMMNGLQQQSNDDSTHSTATTSTTTIQSSTNGAPNIAAEADTENANTTLWKEELTTKHRIHLEQLNQHHKEEQSQWQVERSSLQSTISEIQQQAHEGRIRIQWLENELLTSCPSDTDDDDDDDSNSGNNNKGRQVLLERGLKQVLDSNAQVIQQQQLERDLKIKELQQALQEIQQEKDMDDGMHSRQMVEMKSKLQYQQEQWQRADRLLQLEEQSNAKDRMELAQRIEELELEQERLSKKIANMKTQQTHELSLQKRQLSSLQNTLDESKQREEQLVQRELILKQKLSYQGTHAISGSSRQSSPPPPTMRERTEAKLSPKKEKKDQEDFNKQQQAEMEWMARIEALESQLTQAKGREAVLDQCLADQAKVTEEKVEEVEKAQERIAVLMAFVEN